MIDFTQYRYAYNAVVVGAPRSEPHQGTTTLADSGTVFFHRICDGVLYPEWFSVKFHDMRGSKNITLPAYYLGYIGI